MVGAAVMFIVLLWKWGLWLYRLPLADKKRILFRFLSASGRR